MSLLHDPTNLRMWNNEASADSRTSKSDEDEDEQKAYICMSLA